MAFYQSIGHLDHLTHAGFDAIHPPGAKAEFAGVYRCEGCGHEIGIAKDSTLPPQTHHKHTDAQGDIRWRLIVATNK